MPKRLNDQVDVKVAVADSATGGALVGIATNTTGYSRARFIFTFGDGLATTATVSGNVGIWKAAGSTTTYTSVSTAILSAVSSGAMSSANYLAVIDLPTDPDKPWMKVSGNISSTSMQHTCIVELYDGINRPPTTSASDL